MTSRIRYSLAVLAACGVLAAVGPTITALSSPVPAKSRCVLLQDWARKQFANKAPTLDQLGRYDRAHRVAIAGAITPEARSSMWHEQFRRLLQRSDLSDAQRAYVTEAISLVTPKLYRGDETAMREFKNFQARAKSALTTPQHKRAMYDLGSVAPSGDIVTGNGAPLGRGVPCECLDSRDCFGGPCSTNGCSQVGGCAGGGCTGLCL